MTRYVRRFLTVCLLAIWPVSAALSQEKSLDFVDYSQEVQLGSGTDTQTLSTATLLAHLREQSQNGTVVHAISPVNVEAAISDFGKMRLVGITADQPQVVAAYSQESGIKWIIPEPEPSYVRDINRSIIGKQPTDLLSAASWSATSQLQSLSAELPLNFSVEPFEADGQAYALVHFELNETKFNAGEASGTVSGIGAFVISADFRDMLYFASSYEGSLDYGEAKDRPFKVRRGMVGLDEAMSPLLSASALPESTDLARSAHAAIPTALAVSAPEVPEIPNTALGVISLLSDALDAQIGAEAENRGNIIPVLVVVAAFSTFNTVDGLVATTVNVIGRKIGNEAMRDYPGIGPLVARGTGYALGRAIQVINPEIDPKDWAKGAETAYAVAGLVADGIMILKPDSAAKMVAKAGRFAPLLDKTLKVMSNEYFQIAGAGMGLANNCGGAIFDDHNQQEKFEDCIASVVKYAVASQGKIMLTKDIPVGKVVNFNLKAFDIVSTPEDTVPPPAKAAPTSSAPETKQAAAPEKAGSGDLPRAQKIEW
ncbi:hypothetical protein [Rhizobium sp. L1K21]|uniref:hypothetical protein n=1 Tax=Rhizobium sp. L1K21 TaxID=2954933 RepID=UPI0020936BF2|nr:hypothetical protein [Rhizobium sp. L1K21]MCO6188251.1 hypothetical protein [Rhizobium sp. L1K21]